ncbi:hypothetical protein LMG28727_07068 [Paraburkholderia kirstenboschensis]|nr:hypothetical protein LMG28727_07068 [Paraburkholderia kirstenboschensis]
MSSKFALSVSLTKHLCEFVSEQVASGRYRTVSEVIREALRLLEAQSLNPQPSRDEVAGPTDAAPGSIARDVAALGRGRPS